MAIAKATTKNGLSHLLTACGAEDNVRGFVPGLAEPLLNSAMHAAARGVDDLSASRVAKASVLDLARK